MLGGVHCVNLVKKVDLDFDQRSSRLQKSASRHFGGGRLRGRTGDTARGAAVPRGCVEVAVKIDRYVNPMLTLLAFSARGNYDVALNIGNISGNCSVIRYFLDHNM